MTTSEVDEITMRVRWGGKDGKWRWLTETDDGQAEAGEERLLTVAMSRAVDAGLKFVSETGG